MSLCLSFLIYKMGNDDMNMIRRMSRWMVDNGMEETPLHFSRFFPRYRMQDIPPTPVQTLHTAREIALDEGVQHVYLGNV